MRLFPSAPKELKISISQLKESKENYFALLESLKLNPTDENLKNLTFVEGRKYAEMTRIINVKDSSIQIYTLENLKTDIKNACESKN